MPKERLDKVLVHLGIGTRKEIDKLARAGYITLDGTVVKDSSYKFDPTQTRIEIDGEKVAYREFFHLIIHKPAGYVTSTSDRDGTPITALVPPELEHVEWMPIGRLDKDTEGLLLLTTDGELAHRLTHPRWKVAKRYYVELEEPATQADVQAFAEGFELQGEPLQPAELVLGKNPRQVELIIREGKYHQIKRMFAARGNQVVYLKRLSFGPLEIPKDLAVGEARELRPEEEEALYRVVGLRQ